MKTPVKNGIKGSVEHLLKDQKNETPADALKSFRESAEFLVTQGNIPSNVSETMFHAYGEVINQISDNAHPDLKDDVWYTVTTENGETIIEEMD